MYICIDNYEVFICISKCVCENVGGRGAPRALVEVLVSSGVDEQQLRGALRVCMRRGDGPVVKIILSRLGLDPTNNALYVGGFRLGRLEASWLSALLSECSAPSTAQKKNSESLNTSHTIHLRPVSQTLQFSPRLKLIHVGETGQ